jgi:hypothetical protein
MWRWAGAVEIFRELAARPFQLVIPAEAGIQLVGIYEDRTLQAGFRPPPE